MVDIGVKKVCANSYPEQSAVKDNVKDSFCAKNYAQRPDGLINKQCTMATRAYTLVDTRPERPISLKEYTQKLKLHCIDFEIDSYGENTLLNIKNRRGQTIKTLHYDGGIEAKNLSGYEVMSYNDNSFIPSREAGYDTVTLRPRWINKNYKNAPSELFTKDNISIQTTPNDYIKKLESEGKIRNKDFFVEREKITDCDGKEVPDSESIYIREKDSAGKLTKSMWWFIDPTSTNHVAQSYYDKDEFIYRRITFDQNGTTSVCDYYDKENRKLHDML